MQGLINFCCKCSTQKVHLESDGTFDAFVNIFKRSNMNNFLPGLDNWVSVSHRVFAFSWVVAYFSSL